MCPGFERLIDYLDRRLDAATAQAVAAHLRSGCAKCSADLAWYESFVRVTAGDDSIEPPPWVVNRAIKIFDGKQRRSPLANRLGSIIATLIYDSYSRPSLAGARATETDHHQLLYRAEDYNIDLLLAASGEGTNITGQILRESECLFESAAHLELELLREGERLDKTRTNEVGEFTITAPDSGTYDLRVQAGELSITIVGLTVV